MIDDIKESIRFILLIAFMIAIWVSFALSIVYMFDKEMNKRVDKRIELYIDKNKKNEIKQSNSSIFN